jgi:hypothetical protein
VDRRNINVLENAANTNGSDLTNKDPKAVAKFLAPSTNVQPQVAYIMGSDSSSSSPEPWSPLLQERAQFHRQGTGVPQLVKDGRNHRARLGPSQLGESLELGNMLRSMANGHISLPTCAANGEGALPIGAVNGFGASSAGPKSEFFLYSTSNATACVGQYLELWPVLSGPCHQFLFAAAPELPRGLTIDKRTGLIYGKPQDATDGNTIHFITLCEPSTAKVKIATIYINVVNIMAPGYRISNLVQTAPGVTTLTLQDDPPGVAAMPPQIPQAMPPHMPQAMLGQDPQAQFQQASQLVAQMHDQLMHTVSALRTACAAQNSCH